jgi:hypothetical protein
VGLSQLKPVGRLEESRLPMPWGNDQDRALLGFYQDLIALRRRAGTVWGGPRRTLFVDDEAGLYGYACGQYSVILNNSPHKLTVSTRDCGMVDLASEPDVALEAGGTQLTLGLRTRDKGPLGQVP